MGFQSFEEKNLEIIFFDDNSSDNSLDKINENVITCWTKILENIKNSKFVPLVPNALERVLRPQTNEGERVDMRNLGEVICVKVNTPVLRRTPPTKGRTGFDVKGNTIPAVQGEWIDFKMGTGTVVSDSDANLLMSSISGMPKYRDQVMNIDDTFTCNGVNVGTGHVNYEGAVLVLSLIHI